ncbi:hypothetical protein [Roseibacillus persicicus]|uniref:Uncharacterized protein n=1 Tax=Roseibacillus persicicus TaxID=454148 RepID=A0A918TPH3_9BACT|nr:hypothetical protein [Roseibacillus persicicus]GHC54059.1 hypothetical protein GCM10007100_20470 [Roseibacillus persicicus]
MKFSGLFAALALPLGAQVYTPPKPQPAPAVPTDSAPASNNNQNQSQSPFGQEVPLLDPSAETVTVAGVTIPLGDSRVIKARFEKYLNEPAEDGEAAREYRENIDEILDLLSPQRLASLTGQRGSGPNLAEAFKLLPEAATYPGDARLSSTLAEAVYTAMLAKKDGSNLRMINEKMDEERANVARKADEMARNERANRLGQEKKVTETSEGRVEETLSPGVGEQSLRYQEHLRRLAEIEVLKKANVVRTEMGVVQSKTQYQVTMAQWFLQRRFQHVLMASRFYNQIWRDGDRTLRIEEDSDVSKLFSESLGATPTIATLDSLASEAIRDSEKAISAFEFLLERGEIHNASQRLMEAFALGEYLTPVATLPREKKRQVQGYITDLNLLYGAMQARDYGRAQELITSLKAAAKDFPAAKAEGAVAGYTLASDLAIEEAKASLLAKQSDKAAESIKQAASIWPTNPKLEEFKNMVGSSSELVTSRNDFDRLLSESNYREIAKRAEEGEFILAVRGDEERTAALKQITSNLRKIEGAIMQASEFSKRGADYAAYEQLARIREEFPDDPKLGREIELLAPRVADFTKAIDNAEKLKNRREPQLASALAHYLEAQAIYPDSELAEANIEMLLEEILPNG